MLFRTQLEQCQQSQAKLTRRIHGPRSVEASSTRQSPFEAAINAPFSCRASPHYSHTSHWLTLRQLSWWGRDMDWAGACLHKGQLRILRHVTEASTAARSIPSVGVLPPESPGSGQKRRSRPLRHEEGPAHCYVVSHRGHGTTARRYIHDIRPKNTRCNQQKASSYFFPHDNERVSFKREPHRLDRKQDMHGPCSFFLPSVPECRSGLRDVS